jgi:FKBP-type peptidyl-prolyl cis-trans isomerase FkpA
MSVTAVPLRPIKKGSVLKLWLALIVLTLAAVAFAWWGTQGQQVVTLDSGVRYRVMQEGNGPTVTPNDAVALRYKLRVNNPDGEVIQDSDQTGQPFVATTGMVYPGFGEALQRMSAGGSYLLWLPPGTHEQGPLRPGTPFTANDTLVFEIEVMQIAEGMAPMLQMQRMQQMQQMMQGAEGQGPEGGAPAGEAGDDSSGRGRGRSGGN